MISKCAVDGTQVEFQCSGARRWFVNFNHYKGAVDTITLEAVMNNTYITDEDFGIDIIRCYLSNSESDAHLIVVGKLNL